MERITDISQLDLTKQYTYADYLTWWFDERVELIKGFVRKMTPAPNMKHQLVAKLLVRKIDTFLIGKKYYVFFAPFDVRLKYSKNDKEITTVVQPDICIICDPSKLETNGCNGAPEMIIEILSINNNKHDVVTKKKLYQDSGVLEYWIVSPFTNIIDVFLLENHKYVLQAQYTEEDQIEVKTLPGLVIDLKDIFEDL